MYRIPVKVFFILFCLLISVTDYASVFHKFSPADTVVKKPVNSALKDTLPVTDSIHKPIKENSFLKSKINYTASDSLKIDMINQKAYLYNNAVVIYEDMKLEAGYIELDFDKNVLYSHGIKDSLGNTIQKPISEQGGEKFHAGEISYNFKTKKGKIKDVITQQGDGYIHGRDIKKDSNNVYFVGNGKYTTCELDHPHFYIGAKKIKVIPNDKIITGPAQLYLLDVPTPLVLPFGYFPNKKGRASGILMPTYGESANWGFFLKDGGFYFGGNDNVDLALRGDLYANGSYGLKANSMYRKRYSYSGAFNLSFSQMVNGDQALPNSTKSNDFLITWSHIQDAKSNPSSRFSANVNAGSSSYNKYNSSVTGNYLTNTMTSNIAYSKTFTGTPFNFSANARHSQNTLTKAIDISLPELALTMNRLYPFKSNTAIGSKWYDKIGISATANARNEINTFDSVLFTNKAVKQMQNGAHFTAPISASFTFLKFLSFSPSITTESMIYYQTTREKYNDSKKKLDTAIVNGLQMANDISFQANFSSHFYGDYFFKTKHLKQIRHVATPTIGYTYRPDFSESQFGYYHNVKADSTGKYQQYSIFQNGIYGTPPPGRYGAVTFSLTNTLEAKTKQQTDTGSITKKVSLIDNFGVSFNYNAAVKTHNWSQINLNGNTKLFKLIDLRANMILDPYQLDAAGNDNQHFELENNRIGRFASASGSISTNLHSKTAKPDNTKKKVGSPELKDEVDYYNSHPNEFIDFNIPWNLNVYCNYNYVARTPTAAPVFTQTATFSGDVSLTKKWRLSLSSGYDLTNRQITLTSINIHRDLHCWEMKFMWVPFGFRQSFSLDINVKSSMLKDLKMTRKKDWQDFSAPK